MTNRQADMPVRPRQDQYTVVARSQWTSKSRRLRVSWFMLGLACGVLSSAALSSLSFSKTPSGPVTQAAPAPYSAQQETMPASAHKPAQQTPGAPSSENISPAGAEFGQPVVLSSGLPNDKRAQLAKTYPLSLSLTVDNGDTLLSMLTDNGVEYAEAHEVIRQIKKVYNPKKLDVGQNVNVQLDKPATAQSPVISSLTLPISDTASLKVTRKGGDSFAIKKIDKPVEKKITRVSGTIDSSLYETGMKAGIPAGLLAGLINAYSYDVDFQRDIREGNRLEVLFEQLQTADGKDAGHGGVLYSELELDDRSIRIYRHVDKSGRADYYNEKGESLRKALLRTPINGARLTSGFGMRKHPLLGYTKMHKGIDFGAATGTPIYAAGDGVVAFAGKKGGYGNYLVLRHNDKYATGYAHLSRFASGLRPGSRVRQGQIVAYVGTTGASTGPHLHYEVMVSGEQVNPAGIKFQTGNTLSGKELASFRQRVKTVQSQLAALRTQESGEVAMIETPSGNRTQN